MLTIVTGGVLFAVSCSDEFESEKKTESENYIPGLGVEGADWVHATPMTDEERKEHEAWLASLPVVDDESLRASEDEQIRGVQQTVPVGGDGGGYFSEKVGCNNVLHSITVWYNTDQDGGHKSVHALQAVFTSFQGNLVTKGVSGKTNEAKSSKVFTFSHTRQLKEIKIFYNKRIDAIAIRQDGSAAVYCGGTGHQFQSDTDFSNRYFKGFFGRCGKRIDKLGMYYCVD